MAFSEDDVKAVWKILNLDRNELKTGSSLRQAMADLEQFDADNGQSLVDDTVELIEQINTLDTQILTAQASGGRQRIDYHGDVSITYKDNASPVTIQTSQRSAKVEELKKLLRLDQYNLTGSAIAKVTGISTITGTYRRHGHSSRVR